MPIQFSQVLEAIVKNLSCYMALLVFAACSSGNNQKTAVVIKLSPETIEVPTIDFASSNPGMIHLFDSDSGEHVMIYNHVIKKLQISAFPSGKLKLSIPLEFENEKRSRRFTGGTLIGRDSIFVTFYPFEVHSSDNFLVGKAGPYVSTNNMNREDFSDDVMSYRLLKLDF